MKRSNIFGIVIAILVVAGIIVFISWYMSQKSPVLLQGEVEATSYTVSSKIAGRIDSMLVREGQQVYKGQLLYVLSTPEIDAKLRQAQAAQKAASAQDKKALRGARPQQIQGAYDLWQKALAGLELAQKSYDRVKNLYEQGVIPAQKFDEATANLNVMKATASAAKSQYDMALDGTRLEDKVAAAALLEQAESVVSEVEIYAADACLYSPVDGEVSTVASEVGELVGQGYPVITVLDMNDTWVTFNVKETLLPKIKKGTTLTGYVPALDRNIEMVVDYIAVQAQFATWAATRTQGGFDVRTFEVKARPKTKENDLRPGMSVLVDWNEIAQ